MEQETACPATLTTVTRYQIEGDQLRLLNADEVKAAVYRAKLRPLAATVLSTTPAPEQEERPRQAQAEEAYG